MKTQIALSKQEVVPGEMSIAELRFQLCLKDFNPDEINEMGG